MKVADRENGTKKFARVLSFKYGVPSSIREALSSWTAVPKRRRFSPRNLFKYGPDEVEDVEEVRVALERYLKSICHVRFQLLMPVEHR